MQSSIPPEQSPGSTSPPRSSSLIAGGLIGAALVWVLLQLGAPFAEPTIFAAALCVSISPLALKLRKLIGRRASALVLSSLLALGVAAPATWAWSSSFGQIDALVQKASEESPSNEGPGWRGHAKVFALSLALKARASPGWSARAKLGTDVPWGLVGLLGICAYFILADGAKFWAWTQERTRSCLGLSWARALERAGSAFKQTAKGCLWFGAGSFAILWILFAWAVAPAPMAFAVAAACASMLPFVGPVLVASVAAALMGPDNFWGPLALLGGGAGGLGVANNWLRPKWISEASGIPLPAALLGMAGGAIAWGPAGLLAGPALVAAMLSLVQATPLNEPMS